jgi:hypothetical protein
VRHDDGVAVLGLQRSPELGAQSRKGSGDSKTPLTTLYTAVALPTPNAIVNNTTAAKPGAFVNTRNAPRRSCSNPIIAFLQFPDLRRRCLP